MNIVEAFGSTKKKRELAIDVVHLCIKKLMPRIRTLNIDVEFENIGETFGYCEEGDTNRDFTLIINKNLSIDDLVTTIAHEMVHVKQYARNELTHINGKHMWKSRLYNEDYYNSPWEKEAYALEEGLALFCTKNL